jgi:hypothetical protein
MCPLSKSGDSGDIDIEKQLRKAIQQCPICQTIYDDGAIVDVQHYSDISLLHCTCQICQNALMAMVSSTALGMSVIGIMTDLILADVERLIGGDPVSEDELLGFHRLLKNEQKKFLNYLNIT